MGHCLILDQIPKEAERGLEKHGYQDPRKHVYEGFHWLIKTLSSNNSWTHVVTQHEPLLPIRHFISAPRDDFTVSGDSGSRIYSRTVSPFNRVSANLH